MRMMLNGLHVNSVFERLNRKGAELFLYSIQIKQTIMIRIFTSLIYLSFLLYSCQSKIHPENTEQAKEKILETEKEFAAMAQQEGIEKAFLYFCDENAVLMRNDKLISGKEAIQNHFHTTALDDKNVKLSWEPDFVDVASSCDLGYTYGKYLFTATDSLGNEETSEGIFHTVWKKQPDGSWKFVWD